jgi:hypothetical protein
VSIAEANKLSADGANVKDERKRQKAALRATAKFKTQTSCTIFHILFFRERMFSSAVSVFRHCAGHGETFEKQIAMIAQKIINAKHAQHKRRRFIAAPETITTAFWATLTDHSNFFHARVPAAHGFVV